MSHPLGVRFHERKRKKLEFKPPVDHYMVSVFIPALAAEGAERVAHVSGVPKRKLKAAKGQRSAADPQTAPRDNVDRDEPTSVFNYVVPFILPNGAAPDDLLRVIFERFPAAVPGRQAHQCMLIPTFADFTIDETARALYGDGRAMKQYLTFPYTLTVATLPFVTKMERVQREAAVAHQLIVDERREMAHFFVAYAELMGSVVHAHRKLWLTDLDARARMRLLELDARTDCTQNALFREEKVVRAAVEKESDDLLQLWMASTTCLMEYSALVEGQMQTIDGVLSIEHRRLHRALFNNRLFYSMYERLDALYNTSMVELDDYCRLTKNAYTIARLATEAESARAADVDIDIFQARRSHNFLEWKRLPDAEDGESSVPYYGLVDCVDKAAAREEFMLMFNKYFLCGDLYTSTTAPIPTED